MQKNPPFALRPSRVRTHLDVVLLFGLFAERAELDGREEERVGQVGVDGRLQLLRLQRRLRGQQFEADHSADVQSTTRREQKKNQHVTIGRTCHPSLLLVIP